MKKTLLITNIPTPYRIPLFGELRRQLWTSGWQLKVLFAAPTYERRKWPLAGELPFDHEILGTASNSFGSNYNPVFTYRGLITVLRAERPEMVIVSGFSLATLKVALWSVLTGRPFIIWSGSTSENGSVLRKLFRVTLARMAAAAVCYGSKACTYMMRLGMREEDVHIAINTVDVAFFRDRTAALAASEAEAGKAAEHAEHKRRHGRAPGHFLYVGDLIHRKRVDLLLHAARELSHRRKDFVLEIVGEGPLEEPLKRLAADLGIEQMVRFEGFRQKEELPTYLARASGFVFPTESDVWGLVLIEAMAAGLPCVASVRAGATADVIRHGENGFAVSFKNRTEVADCLQWILEHPQEAAEIGRRASEFVSERMNLAVSAGGFVAAVERQVRAKPVLEKARALYDVS